MPGEGASCGDAAGVAVAAPTTSAVRFLGGRQRSAGVLNDKLMGQREVDDKLGETDKLGENLHGDDV